MADETPSVADIIIDTDGKDYEVSNFRGDEVEGLDADFNAKWFNYRELELVEDGEPSTFKVAPHA